MISKVIILILIFSNMFHATDATCEEGFYENSEGICYICSP
jgi:hypothetical protein